ncbi:MAG TPA: GNAT family N-acetyltransferase [Fimbriimonadaceae bacterium]|nr:GNAT family N-acetyltransferase [Fimbriimonadaceae bacterium]HRJ33587.1 GNAT family N-acetyltransferase [Fimbriimonadaceae bacterium]
MIEIRPIAADEAPGFLSLLCEVFGLDVSRAESVFYTEPYFDLNRKWALFEKGNMRSILTTTPLEFGWGRAMGIAGVATHPKSRGRGLAQQLIEMVLQSGKESGESAAMLFAQSTRLYEHCGFEVVEEVIRGPLRHELGSRESPPCARADVEAIYSRWSEADPARLRRDDRRWRAWSWTYRIAEVAGDGYICFESNLVREAIVSPDLERWPVYPGTDWVGMRQFSRNLGVPLIHEKFETYVMAKGFPSPPQMFLTDQF